MHESNCEQVTDEERVYSILDQLILIELRVIDPSFTGELLRQLGAAKNDVDRMRADNMLSDRIFVLRESNKLSSSVSLTAIAATMINYSPQEMLAAFTKYDKEFREKSTEVQ